MSTGLFVNGYIINPNQLPGKTPVVVMNRIPWKRHVWKGPVMVRDRSSTQHVGCSVQRIVAMVHFLVITLSVWWFFKTAAQTSPGVGGWAYPLWKMIEFVSWDDEIPNMMGKIKNVPNWNQWLCSAMNYNNHIWGKELLRMMLGHIGGMIHRVSARATSPTYVLFTSNLAAR